MHSRAIAEKPLTVIRATSMGMCFGVEDALETVRSLEDPEAVTIHGELVHNDEVLREMKERGFRMVVESRRNVLPSTPTVVVTAHGVSDRERSRLAAAGKTIVDTTCPLVRVVHRAAQRMQSENRFVVVVGREGHVEVSGLVEDLNHYVIVNSKKDVRNWGEPSIGVVSQSTTSPAKLSAIRQAIEEKNSDADIKFVDTICDPTRQRQQAVDTMLAQVEAVVVVGGHNSNNTRQLVRRAEQCGIPALHVQTSDDLDREWFTPFACVGLTAGTSTPSSTVEEVHARLLALRPAS